MEPENLTTYERSVPRRSSCPGGSSRITYHHVDPFGWMSEDNPTTQFGGNGISHGVPKAKSLRAGMLNVVLTDFKDANAWERGILLQRTMTGYMVFLINWGLESEQCLSSIRLLPRNLAKMAPWARKIILPGVRDQPNQAKRHRVAQFTTLRRTESLINIDPFPGEATTARLLLDREPLESARDMAAY